MPKRSSKRDDFQNALRVVEEAIGESLTKNPAAVALGRRGGLKGGPARAEKLSAKERTEIAQQAAKTPTGPGWIPSVRPLGCSRGSCVTLTYGRQ